jgi:glycerol-3-phosphate dehydrogenase
VRAIDHVRGGEIRVRARLVLNATGPWVDAVCRLAGDPGEPRLKPTKGVHLVVPDRGLASAFLLLHPGDGRVLFVIPWQGKTLIGTTDTHTDAGPEGLAVTPGEMAYLLEAHNHYFSPALGPGDVLSCFVGLRPLVRARRDEPSAMSREFRLFKSPSGLLSVAGGKYTTYRHMAEVITDEVCRQLGRRRWCLTRNCPLDGAPRCPWEEFEPSATAALKQSQDLSEGAARHLVKRYGRRAADVAAYLHRQPDMASPVVSGEPDLQAEFAYQKDYEMAIYPADYLLRRTKLGLFHPELLANSDGFQRKKDESD